MIYLKFFSDNTPAVIGGVFADIETGATGKFNTIEEALNIMQQHKRIYFFNGLADATFLMYYLFENGYSYSMPRKKKSFFAKISAGNSFYYMRIYKENLQKIEISDAYHLIPIAEEELYNFSKIQLQTPEEKAGYIAKLINERPEKKALTLSGYIKNDVFNYISESDFYRNFPILEQDAKNVLRLAYKGGFNWLDNKYRGRKIENVLELDVNHLYPFLLSNALLPYGYPRYSKGEFKPSEAFPLGIQIFSCAYKLKKNGLAFLSVDALYSDFNFKAKESSDNKIVTLAMPYKELKFFLKNYNVYCLEYIEYYAFRGKKGILKKYVNHFNKIKENSNGIEREIAKRKNNLLTGLFGELDRMTVKTPYLKDSLIKYHYTLLEKHNARGYLPAAVFINSYGRLYTAKLAKKYRNNFIYSDTDSCYFHDIPATEFNKIVDKNKMGKWKLKKWDYIIFMKEKEYMAFNKNETKQVIAGLPKRYKLTEKQFKNGKKIKIKIPVRVPGGYIEKSSFFTIGT